MHNVTPADVLRALKKFKRLAKQDLLASELTSDPDFWRGQAEARREMYDILMALVESEGVDAAHRHAVDEHASLPLLGSAGDSAVVKGKKQALQMFFTILGVDEPGHSNGQSASASDDEHVPLEATS